MKKEEAIEIVKEFINGTCLHLVDREALEILIPELRESGHDCGYQDGYEQAKKDYALTWKDIRQICTIADDFFDENDHELSDEEFFTKILKQFKIESKKYESKED